MLFIFSLFFATVLGSSPVDIFTGSASFLATLSNADPDIVNQMIALIGDLEKEGKEDAASALATAVASEKSFDHKAAVHADMVKLLNLAKDELVAATGIKNELTVLEAAQRATLEAAVEKRDGAQKHADEKEASFNSIEARVTKENKAFAEVLDLLDSVVVPEDLITLGRNLLSFDNADPDAVAAVKAQVEALIKAADEELNVATNQHKDAQKRLTSAKAEHKVAESTHSETSGKLSAAIEVHKNKVTAEKNAQTAKDEAFEAMNKAGRKAHSDRAFSNAETERVAKEAKALADAKDLLKTLL